MSWTAVIDANLNKIAQELYGIEMSHNEEICPHCEKIYRDEKEKEFIERFGECFECYIKSYR